MRNRIIRTSVAAGLVIAVAGAATASTPTAIAASPATSAPARALEVLVTNDDGVGAGGIDAVVEALRLVPNVNVTVVAPATNQSGTGDAYTTSPLTIAATTTASGYPATSVSGKPADTVFYAVKQLGLRPDVVVSGVNFGQNIADFVTVSGTVGAARTAGRLGIPSIAVSAGLSGNVDFQTPASITAVFVMFFRSYYLLPQTGATAKIFNLNTPACATGSLRGLAFVPIGRAETVTGYQDLGGGSVQATTTARNILDADCTSTKTTFTDDLDAMNNGFASVTLMNPDLTDI